VRSSRARSGTTSTGGNLEASFAFSGQVAGRIDEVVPVARILRETIAECESVLRQVGARYG
jgi:hypothetical protein